MNARRPIGRGSLMSPMLLACLALAVGGAEDKLGDLRKRLEPLETEMRQIQQRMDAIRAQIQDLAEGVRSSQRTRSIEAIRQEHEALSKQLREEDERLRETMEQYGEIQRVFFRREKEQAAGLHEATPSRCIRAGFAGWDCQGRAAATAFCARHPAVRFFNFDLGADLTRQFRLGEIDLMGLTRDPQDYLGGAERQKFREALPEVPEPVLIGYWPFAVAVHPSNPLEVITLEQLRILATNRKATWKDFGRAEDGLVRLHIYDADRVAALVTGKKALHTLGDHRVRTGGDSYRPAMEAIAADPDVLLIWNHTERIAGSGLKILPIPDANQTPVLPTDLPAVASGRYPLRTPLTIVVHPQASDAARQFAQWLVTAEAAEALQADRDRPQPADVPLLAHVTLAAQDERTRQKPADAPARFDTEEPPATGGSRASESPAALALDGAAAVMPTEPLNRYFLMGNPAHHAAYENAITEAIRADGRLRLIDRPQLGRVLEEHVRKLDTAQQAPPRPIVAADVFVFSYVTSNGGGACLQVDAVHGPTASRLGSLTLPIDPADPLQFTPPLDRAVNTWWPSVLERLADIRRKPVWTVVDVYAGGIGLAQSAEAMHNDVEQALASEPRVFLAQRVPLSQTQEEVLLHLMGLSRSGVGRFSPAADYLLEARLTASDRIELRLRGANLTVLEQAELAEPDRAKLQTAVLNWLAAQVARYSTRPQRPASEVTAEDDWAVAQARLEYEIGRQWSDKSGRRQQEYEQTRADMARRGMGAVTMEDHPQLVEAMRDRARYEEAARRHYRRAAQLDPTWEKAAAAALPADLGSGDLSFRERADVYEAFLRRFSHSENIQRVLGTYIHCCTLAARESIPPGLDEGRTRLVYWRKALDGCRQYIGRYTLQGKRASDWMDFMPYKYLYFLRQYVALAEPSEAEGRAIVQEWSDAYDDRLDLMPHSDFVRLIVLAQRNDRPGFVDVLTRMQQRWPDPKHPQWKQGKDMVCELNHSLFYNVFDSFTGRDNSLTSWLEGKRGIGDLPYPGYDPGKEVRQPRRFMIGISTRGNLPPIRALLMAYRASTPGSDFGIGSANEYTIDRFARGHERAFAYCGELSERERRLLEMMHRSPPRQVVLGYWAAPDPNREAASDSMEKPGHRPLVLLAQHEPDEAIQDFLRWLTTEEARQVLAENGVVQDPKGK